MLMEASTLPLNHFHDHLPSTELVLTKSVLLPIIFTDVILEAPTC